MRIKVNERTEDLDAAATLDGVRHAIDAVLKTQPVSSDQKPSMGCNIKWKPGNEPDYF